MTQWQILVYTQWEGAKKVEEDRWTDRERENKTITHGPWYFIPFTMRWSVTIALSCTCMCVYVCVWASKGESRFGAIFRLGGLPCGYPRWHLVGLPHYKSTVANHLLYTCVCVCLCVYVCAQQEHLLKHKHSYRWWQSGMSTGTYRCGIECVARTFVQLLRAMLSHRLR